MPSISLYPHPGKHCEKGSPFTPAKLFCGTELGPVLLPVSRYRLQAPHISQGNQCIKVYILGDFDPMLAIPSDINGDIKMF